MRAYCDTVERQDTAQTAPCGSMRYLLKPA
jgi:hypothetical protein